MYHFRLSCLLSWSKVVEMPAEEIKTNSVLDSVVQSVFILEVQLHWIAVYMVP